MAYVGKGAGTLGVQRARRRERDAVERVVEEARAREAAAKAEALADLDAETGASPYREAEEIARGLHRGR